MSIYTKTGDTGMTSKLDGKRVSKNDLDLQLYGGVDEINAYIGLIRNYVNDDTDSELLILIQNELFKLGSLLACDPEKWESYKLAKFNEDITIKLEDRIDQIDKKVPKLNNFVLPGGNIGNGFCHVLRTTVRRVERQACARNEESLLPSGSLKFLNRLSDYFFILGRWLIYKNNNEEIIWKN